VCLGLCARTALAMSRKLKLKLLKLQDDYSWGLCNSTLFWIKDTPMGYLTGDDEKQG
jgi:hypothetical protein